MSLGFPVSPILDQIYSIENRSWKWNGKGWALLNVGPTGPAGPLGATGVVGPTGPAAAGGAIIVNTTEPTSPGDGYLWWEPTQQVLSVYSSLVPGWVNVNGNTDDWGLITGLITIYDDYGSI